MRGLRRREGKVLEAGGAERVPARVWEDKRLVKVVVVVVAVLEEVREWKIILISNTPITPTRYVPPSPAAGRD